MSMQSLNFDEGYKEFCINGDESRVIRFNPSDIGIIERFNEAEKNIAEYQKGIEDIPLANDGTVVELDNMEEYRKFAELLGKTRKYICDQVDYIFDSHVSEAAFGNQSPLCSIKGKLLFERFIDSIKPIIKKEVEAENAASQKRIDKYRKAYHK